MMEIMRSGKITCECGNEFYFRSVREEVPCMACGMMHPNNGEPVPEPTPEEELTEPENE